jgi:hypothetical protein
MFLICTKLRIFSRQNFYFAIIEQHIDINVDNPVFAETLEIGKVADIITPGAITNKLILKLAIDNEINIPDESYLEIEKDQSITKQKIKIQFVSSNDYFQNNDTIPVKSFIIEPIKTDSLFTAIQKSPADTSVVKKAARSDTPKNKQADVKFFVQILTSEKELALNSKKFKGIEEVMMYEDTGIYKYYVGKDLTFEGSIQLCDDLKNKGFTDAFVIALKNNQRISVKQALQILEK